MASMDCILLGYHILITWECLEAFVVHLCLVLLVVKGPQNVDNL